MYLAEDDICRAQRLLAVAFFSLQAFSLTGIHNHRNTVPLRPTEPPDLIQEVQELQNSDPVSPKHLIPGATMAGSKKESREAVAQKRGLQPIRAGKDGKGSSATQKSFKTCSGQTTVEIVLLGGGTGVFLATLSALSKLQLPEFLQAIMT